MLLQHVTTTDVYYYLAFKMIGQHNMVVAYRSLLPRLHVLQPVYQQLLQDLTPAADTSMQPATCTKQNGQ